MSFSAAKIVCSDTNTSLSASSLVAEPITGVAFLELPVIAASPTTGQAAPGSVLFIRNLEAVSIRIADPNTLAGQNPLGGTIAPNASAVLVAGDDGVWHRENGTTLATSSTVAVGTTSLVNGSKAPAAIATPTAIAGFLPVALPNGSIGYVPFWQ